MEVYEMFPMVIVAQSEFELGSATSEVGTVDIVLNELFLDGRRVGGRTPFDMWVYNGSAELREHCLQELTARYYKRNYLGVLESFDGGGYQPDYRHGSQPGFGGGTPVVSIWGRGMGLAIGHLERSYRRCSLPVKVDDGRSVSLRLVQHLRHKAAAVPVIQSIESFIVLHEGDFFNALDTYRRMMVAKGVSFPAHPDEAYQPQWDSWGFGADFNVEEILETVPHLRDMGIRSITLDDRWYDATGDWLPRKDRFPGGEEEFARFIQGLHEQGMRVRLWTLPVEVDGAVDTEKWLKEHPSAITEVQKHPYHCRSRFHQEHSDSLVLGPNGQAEISKRGNCFCCGSLPEVREHFRRLTRRMFEKWGIDGLKQDAVYICSACYSLDHGHASPDDASSDYAEILRVIYETALKHRPEAVILNCPCGTTLTPDWMRWQNQAISPDPWTSWVNRGIVKQLKALFGPSAAILLDHIELSDEGMDFSLIGVGGVPATRITPTGQEKSFGVGATLGFEEKKQIWTRWIGVYRDLMLSQGEYLNLYDFAYDTPETHVIRKGDRLFYAFYPGEPDGIIADERELYEQRKVTKRFKGTLEFRGLEEAKRYSVFDYENQLDLGIVEGGRPFLKAEIDHHLLVVLTEI
jgi:alpha-galactosidase